MKVILRKDVPKLGTVGDVKNVADGFGRNYLIPYGFAILATEGELKTLANNKKAAEYKTARAEKTFKDTADKIQGKTLTFTAKMGEQGRLYGSITAGDIAERLTEMVGTEIERRKVVLEDPIRTVGEHTVSVHLVGRLRPTITVVVIGEGGDEEVAAPVAEEGEGTAEEVAAE